ncbi:MAG: hypothetical protein EXS42_07745 [Lacunisphaera sp.]|nr:hypothetical protein [Lacunisphaera sp.]
MRFKYKVEFEGCLDDGKAMATPTATPPNKSNPKAGTTILADPEAGVFFDGDSGAYDDALFSPATFARAATDLESLSEDDFAFYGREGYLAVSKAFTQAEVDAAMQGLVNLASGF